MITAAVVTFHTSRKDLIRLIDCVLHSSIDKFFIIDNSTNDALREFESTSERITYIYSDNLLFFVRAKHLRNLKPVSVQWTWSTQYSMRKIPYQPRISENFFGRNPLPLTLPESHSLSAFWFYWLVYSTFFIFWRGVIWTVRTSSAFVKWMEVMATNYFGYFLPKPLSFRS